MIRQHRLVEPVTKFMILLGGLFTSNASAQHNLSAVKLPHGPLYPYRDKSGKFGYADERLRIHIQPQYHTAGLFTPQGFAIITDSLGRKGVIDTNNTKIIPAFYDQIHLSETEDFTLVETYHWYDVRWRFWEWQFLPGFSFLGTRGDNRLFDTKVKRLKRTVLILRDRPKKVRRECLTDNGLKNNYFKLRILDGNQILIDDRLYQIRANGAHFLAAGVKELLSSQTLAQHKNQRLYLINRKGKRLKGRRYRTIDAIPMRLGADLLMTPLARASSRPIATTYQNDEGRIFIYPDFSKAFPLLINENPRPEDPSAKALIQGLWLLASVPRSDYFVCISNLNGKQYYRFLDRQGNWHRNLPPSISFTVVRPSGDILWPAQEAYLPKNRIPENWEIDRISALADHDLYRIGLRQDQTVRQGIWNAEKKHWLIHPEYDQIYAMNKTPQWRYQKQRGELWGILDANGKSIRKPTYHHLSSDGWVRLKENGEDITFYVHPPTGKAFREKNSDAKDF